MLKLLRKHSRSWIIAVAIGAIVVVFIFWGIGGFQSERFQEVATVNGQPILLTTYIRQYNQMVRDIQERTGGELSEADFQALNLKERALNRLIEQVLLLQAAKRMGLSVSTPELQEHIRSLPYFQVDGKFSPRRYQALLRRARVTAADFESGQRQNLLIQKVIRTVTAFAKVSDGELEELYRLVREKVEVNYLVLSPESYLARQKPSEAAIASYYQKHKQEFRLPDRVRVRFMLFRPQDFAAQAQPTPEEVAEYLREHEEEFSQPQVIRVRELFLAVPPQAPPSKRRELQRKAQSLLEQARTGKDFKKLVEAHSQDADSRQRGGDLGDVKRGERPAAWEKVAFSLAPGEVGLAETAKGFHLIKLEEIKSREKLPEAEAKARATRKLQEQKSRELAQEAARRARGEADPANFVEVAKKFKAHLQETPLFALGDQIPGLELTRTFKQTALALKVRQISKVTELPSGFAVIQCVERQPARVPPLEKVKDKVRLAVSRQLARAQAEKEAAALLKRLQKGESLQKVAAAAKVPLKSSGWFTRSQGFLRQPLARSLTTAAFLLTPQKPYPPEPLFWKGQYYILAFKARRAPSPEEFQKEKEALRQRVLEQKKRLLFEAWLARERQQADIKIFELPS
ncbi:MAG: SurA N-terminal domain-containing protein [Deltaproteobacteria bacterium]|nr:SurA N-terminal domain-containing protein [Deltaproteobacteria bacterium]